MDEKHRILGEPFMEETPDVCNIPYVRDLGAKPDVEALNERRVFSDFGT